jgi:hypothetical protein
VLTTATMNLDTIDAQAEMIVLKKALQRTSCRDSILFTQQFALKAAAADIKRHCHRTRKIMEDKVLTLR